ncbi:MAG TPA: class II aldolase/adducin family protein [Abditibacteriaceae bacterium]|nr:class II aldolase/adducin family protein [Abditibacteriaceae bacterium]
MSDNSILTDLIALSRHLGEEWREYAIIGEGNTSARADDATFWVKASGSNLRTIDEKGFVRMRLDRVLSMLETAQTDDDVTHGLNEAKADPGVAARPSIETVLHAICLAEGGAQVVGHTHPVAVNVILCSQQAESLLRHLMPDVVVVCGAMPVLVPYADPGLPLARAVRAALHRNIAEQGAPPQTIYLQNHGLFALGQTVREVENITAMAVKNARILAPTFALGGPNFLSDTDVARINTRLDEILRRRQFAGKA